MNKFPVALGHGNEVITFDIGGTSFRSALLTREGRLTSIQRIPSINCRSLPGTSAADIVDEIADYIARTAQSLWCSPALVGQQPAIAISMGAAMNAHTGMILGSGPILGQNSSSFDLESVLRQRLPDARITIVNDVTASVVAHSLIPGLRHARRLALITVSTGIASRTLNCSVPHVPVDPVLGTQGEIGHHRVTFSLAGTPLSLKCDCGGVDHLSAFSSGQGIKRVVNRARDIFPEEFCASDLNQGDPTSNVNLDALAKGLANHDPLSKKLLDAVTLPIAEAIKWHFMLDPEIDKLILTGGVCFLLRDFYLSSVIENLRALEFYPLMSDAESFWRNRVILGPISDDAGLVGAAHMGRELPDLHRRETLGSDFPFRVARQTAIEYPIHLAEDLFENRTFPRHLLEPFERIVLVADAMVNEIYGDEIRELLAGTYRPVETIVVRASEKEKDLTAVSEIVAHFDAIGVRRRKDLIVAAGGGITLDLTALASTLFRRGVPCLRLPTTLLAEIDAGIGVKNAVNFHEKKSRLGTFAPPYAVIVAPRFLATLPDRQIRNGLSEALKIALVADRQLFELLDEHAFSLLRTKLQCAQGSEIIRRSIRAMLLELAPNLYERVLTRLPDYGHTFSPIFEFELHDLQHGEAVALDMAVSTGLAVVMDLLDNKDAEHILITQYNLGLPIVQPGLSVDMLMRGAHEAKKTRGGRLRMPVLCGIGEAVFVDEVTQAEFEKALAFVQRWYHGRMLEVAQSA